MMGRGFIYPGDKQIRALLRPVCRGTTAYINILSWVIQVSKGFTHPHFHKGPPSTPRPHGPTAAARCQVLILLLLVFAIFPPCFPFVHSFSAPPNFHCNLGALQKTLNPLWHRRITCWQTVRRSSWKTELGWHLWTRCSDLWTRAGFEL